MNTIKNFTTIHLWLNQIDLLEFVFDDIINIKYFNPKNIKIEEKPYKDILIYYIGYVTIKD